MAHVTIIATSEGQEVHPEVEAEIEKSKRGIVGSSWKSTLVCSGIEEVVMKVKSKASSPKIKEESITPKLEYLPPPVSPDPNNYCWGSQEIWNKICTLCHLHGASGIC